MQAHSLEAGKDEGDRRAMEVRCIRVALPSSSYRATRSRHTSLAVPRIKDGVLIAHTLQRGKRGGVKSAAPITPNTQRNPYALDRNVYLSSAHTTYSRIGGVFFSTAIPRR